LDADDSWHPEKLHIQFNYMINNIDVVVSGHLCQLFNTENKIKKFNNEEINVKKIISLSLLFKNAFSTPTVMIKNEINNRFIDGKNYAEDFYLWQEISFTGKKIIRLEIPLAFIHKDPFGAGGLSAYMWKMQKGEIENFIFLWRAKKISISLMLLAVIYSFLKFVRRLLINFKKNGFKKII
jgi:hypothetical protein